MANQIIGTILNVGPVQELMSKSGNAFLRRELTVAVRRYDPHTGEPADDLDNTPQLAFIGDRCRDLDAYQPGQVVAVSFDVRGRRYTDQQTGATRIITDISPYRIEAYRPRAAYAAQQAAPTAQAAPASAAMAATVPTATSDPAATYAPQAPQAVQAPQAPQAAQVAQAVQAASQGCLAPALATAAQPAAQPGIPGLPSLPANAPAPTQARRDPDDLPF